MTEYVAKPCLVFSREVLPDAELEKLYAESRVTFNAYAALIR